MFNTVMDIKWSTWPGGEISYKTDIPVIVCNTENYPNVFHLHNFLGNQAWCCKCKIFLLRLSFVHHNYTTQWLKELFFTTSPNLDRGEGGSSTYKQNFLCV